MRNSLCFLLISGLALFFSAPVFGHVSHSGEGLMSIVLHPFTGLDHLLMLILVVGGIATAKTLYRRFR